MPVNTSTFEPDSTAAELTSALEGHRSTFGARVPQPSSAPLLKLGQDGSVIDRHGNTLLAKPPVAK